MINVINIFFYFQKWASFNLFSFVFSSIGGAIRTHDLTIAGREAKTLPLISSPRQTLCPLANLINYLPLQLTTDG